MGRDVLPDARAARVTWTVLVVAAGGLVYRSELSSFSSSSSRRDLISRRAIVGAGSRGAVARWRSAWSTSAAAAVVGVVGLVPRLTEKCAADRTAPQMSNSRERTT